MLKLTNKNDKITLDETAQDFIFDNVSEGIVELNVRNLITNKYERSGLFVYSDDISLSNRLTEAVKNIADMVNNLKDNTSELSDTLKTAIDESFELPEDEKLTLTVLVNSHINMVTLEPISLEAITKFDEIFGEGSLNNIIKLRYGRVLTPNLLFILKLFCFISEFSAAFASSNLSKNIDAIKARLKHD